MLRDVPVRDVMTTDVLTFAPEDNVQDAMRQLLRHDIDGAPVVDAGGQVVGLLSTADLIVEEARVHLPTVITLLGAYLELPSSKKRFDEDMEKALGSTVGEVMDGAVETIGPDATVEQVATVLHEQQVDRVPVVGDDGHLLGIVARGDIVKAIVREFDSASSEEPGATDATGAAADRE